MNILSCAGEINMDDLPSAVNDCGERRSPVCMCLCLCLCCSCVCQCLYICVYVYVSCAFCVRLFHFSESNFGCLALSFTVLLFAGGFLDVVAVVAFSGGSVHEQIFKACKKKYDPEDSGSIDLVNFVASIKAAVMAVS